MKKTVSILMALVMAAVLTVTSLAAPAGFISSPSAQPAPEVVEITPADDDATGTVIVTPYSERKDLPQEKIELIEKALEKITEAETIVEVISGLADIAAEAGIADADLAVSDIFDISYAEGSSGKFQIKLKPEALEKFVALIHFNGEEWEVVEGAKISEDGESIEFTADDFSPFAIVVDNTPDEDVDVPVTTPAEDDGMNIWVIVAAGAALILIIIVVAKKSKKKK